MGAFMLSNREIVRIAALDRGAEGEHKFKTPLNDGADFPMRVR
jgi:hypothetical protein